MLEMFNDMSMLWFSLSMMVMLVTAFTKVNVYRIEWDMRASWRTNRLIDLNDQKETNPFLIPLSVKSHHPKIPSRNDHNSDDEDPTVVFMKFQ